MNFISLKTIGFFCLILTCNITSAQYYENDPELIKTASGLKYKITKQGQGLFPKPGDRVWVHYYAKFENDSIYDTTAERGPLDVYLGQGQLIKGWEEGLQLVKPGGAILLVVPPELGYGNTNHDKIPANSTLIFEIALLQVNSGNNIEPFNTEGKTLKKAKKKLQYYTIVEGEGSNAKFGDNAFVHYTAFLPDGTIFDSSHKKGNPVQIIVGMQQVFAGWDMGLLLMKKGSKIKLIIPSKLAYGKNGYKSIVPPNTNITLDLEMVDLIPPKPVKKWDATGKNIIETASGLKYVIFEKGQGDLIQDDDVVTVHYSGYFTNGKLFDSSVKTYKPIQFPIGANAVIDGWDEGLKLMRKGAKFQLLIPSSLAYGSEGMKPLIPPHTDLIFDIEVLEVIK